MSAPLAYFITFTCFGQNLPGAIPLTVGRKPETSDPKVIRRNRSLFAHQVEILGSEAYELGSAARRIVLDTIIDVCRYRGWVLFAAHVRMTHVHVVVRAIDVRPEFILNTFKAYASRALNAANLDPKGTRRWARHGSTQWLGTPTSLVRVIRYVVHRQGRPMAVFVAEGYGRDGGPPT